MESFICDNIGTNDAGRLTFAGQDTVELAARYGTPLYLMDEDRIRENCRTYVKAFAEYFPAGSMVLYAGKAAAFKRMYTVVREEGLGIDAVSCGELATAEAAGFPLERAFFHSNNKTDEDIVYAVAHGVGYFVVDCAEEIDAIERAAAARGTIQRVLLRITPGIDTHTYEAVNTGKVDSMFGSAIETGQAAAITEKTLGCPHIELAGFHCHVGSQVFAEDVFERSAEVMLAFMAEMKDRFGYEAEWLDLGGGYGVRYVASDPTIDIAAKIGDVAERLNSVCARLGLAVPKILMEPGRSIVADAGMTLYTVGSVKRIPGYKNYISTDGGMTDNPRYALYGSEYTCYNAGRMAEPRTLTADLVGRCCESGDIIMPAVPFPETTQRGDIAAVCTTGAYNYSMASNYNRLGRPPVVMLSGGESSVAVRRESLEDLLRLDV